MVATIDAADKAPQFHYQIIIDGDIQWTVPNGVVLDRMVRKALGHDWSVEVELRDGQPAPSRVCDNWKVR